MHLSGETDLGKLLNSLKPVLADIDYGFATLPPGSPIPTGLQPIGTFQEAEGLSIIAPTAQFLRAGISHSGGWALITLRVHSSLQAVGMMAAIATALANAGISVNVVAGFYHDHLFVQWDRRHDAVQILAQLGNRA